MLKLFFTTLLFSFVSFSHAQTGIETSNPESSAALELQATDKGFKGPNVPLTDKFDTNTIPNPATGLLVYNIQNSGIPPNEVISNRYYFWNGSEWMSLPGSQLVEELVKPKVFYCKSSATQNYPSSNFSGEVIITFSPSDIQLNIDNNITLTNNTFRINTTGLYEVSSYINYNPNGSSSNRALQNLKIQRRQGTSGAWVDVAGTRGTYGFGSASDFKTLVIPLSAVYLNEGDFIRIITQNPYSDQSSSTQGTGQIATGGTSTSKSLRIQLIDFNF